MREGPAEGWEDGKAARQSERRRQRQKDEEGKKSFAMISEGANEAGGFREG